MVQKIWYLETKQKKKADVIVKPSIKNFFASL